jgi:uncharacterized protein (TIRG00374 family)
MRRHARTAILLALTVGLLGLFLRNADLAGILAEARRARPDLLLLGLVFTGLTYVLRAFRWQYLLAPIGATRFWTALRTTVIGFAASALLPARAGEFLRPYLLAREERLSATSAFATIVLERLLDLVTVLLLFGTFVAVFDPGLGAIDPRNFAAVKFGGMLAALGAAAALAVSFTLAGHPERLGRAAQRVERLLPARLARTVSGFVETFARGFGVLRQPGRLVVALVLSVPLWLSIALGIWLTSRAFHITFAFPGSFLVMTMLVVGVAVPTPGAIGGFHEAYRLSVTAFYAAPSDRAVGAAIVLHAISFLPVTVLGITLMMRDGMSLGGMRRMAEAELRAPEGGRTRHPEGAGWRGGDL